MSPEELALKLLELALEKAPSVIGPILSRGTDGAPEGSFAARVRAILPPPEESESAKAARELEAK